MPELRITIPIPVSGNRYWRVFRGHPVLSSEAREYKASVLHNGRKAGYKPFIGPVAITLRVFRERKARDLDNFLKVSLDALQGVLFNDDSQIVELHAFRFEDKVNPRIEVLCTAAEI